MKITIDTFKDLVDFDKHKALVTDKLKLIGDEYDLLNPWPLLEFFNNYTSWNGYFVGGVAALCAKITKARGCFIDRDMPLRSAADRSNYVASFIFDAARDEYDDHVTANRDPHRSLAQAFLLGLCNNISNAKPDFDDLNFMFKESEWLTTLNSMVIESYAGSSRFTTTKDIFIGMGYHAGSEILADAEFTLVDSFFRNRLPDLHKRMEGSTAELADSVHNCYSWISIHSGDGNAVEQDHFNLALSAIENGLRFSPPEEQAQRLEWVKKGFNLFAENHHTFFSLS